MAPLIAVVPLDWVTVPEIVPGLESAKFSVVALLAVTDMLDTAKVPYPLATTSMSYLPGARLPIE